MDEPPTTLPYAMQKLLSLIIPTYNMEKYLPRALDSVCAANNLEQVEILVVNDGSTDHSLAIAQDYRARFPRSLCVIDKENGNYGSCINAALKVATGRYVKILDADDYYDTSALDGLVELLGKATEDYLVTGFVMRREDGSVFKTHAVPPEESGKTLAADDASFANKPTLWWMHALTVKRSLFIEHNYRQTEGISYTDTEFALFTIFHAKTCKFTDLCLYNYTVGRAGQTVSPEKMARDHQVFLARTRRFADFYASFPKGFCENRLWVLRRAIEDSSRAYLSSVFLVLPYDARNLSAFRALAETLRTCPNAYDVYTNLYDLRAEFVITGKIGGKVRLGSRLAWLLFRFCKKHGWI